MAAVGTVVADLRGRVLNSNLHGNVGLQRTLPAVEFMSMLEEAAEQKAPQKGRATHLFLRAACTKGLKQGSR
jgi:hypothetical protein